MTKSYRVRYTEIKPGGHHARQDESLKGGRRDVVIFLSGKRIVPGSVEVTEYSASDSNGTSLGSFGW